MKSATMSRKHDTKQNRKTDNNHDLNPKYRKELTKNDEQIQNQIVIHVKLKPELVEYTTHVLEIMKNIRYNGVPMAARDDMTMAGLLKKGLKMLLNIYVSQILANDRVVKQFHILNNDVLNNFIEFRAQYMDMSTSEQLNNIKNILNSRNTS